MVLGDGRLSYIPQKQGRFFGQKFTISDQLRNNTNEALRNVSIEWYHVMYNVIIPQFDPNITFQYDLMILRNDDVMMT